MKISEAKIKLQNHTDMQTLFVKFEELVSQIVNKDKLTQAYFEQIVTLMNLQSIKIDGIKFLSFNQRFVYQTTKDSLHNVNLVHVNDTRNGIFATYCNGYQLNRMPVSLPVGSYILLKKNLYFVEKQPHGSLWYDKNSFTNCGIIGNFPQKQTVLHEFYKVNHTKVNADHVFNKKWFVHLQGNSQTRPLILSECENFNDGKYTISQPLMRV